jgi:hypothetical protein
MDLFKKKPSPQELITKISMAESKLAKREAQLRDRKDKAREEAKNCLKNGDERGFRVASKQFGSVMGQLNTLGSMLEMASTMRNALEDQQALTEIVAIGGDLAAAQKSMGLDPTKLEATISNINASIQKVTQTSEALSTQMDLLSSPEASSTQESLKAELMAELKADTGQEDSLEAKIKAAQGQK